VGVGQATISFLEPPELNGVEHQRTAVVIDVEVEHAQQHNVVVSRADLLIDGGLDPGARSLQKDRPALACPPGQVSEAVGGRARELATGAQLSADSAK
jgi:hypothetical protein